MARAHLEQPGVLLLLCLAPWRAEVKPYLYASVAPSAHARFCRDESEAAGADKVPRLPDIHGLWLVRQVAAQISVLAGAARSRVTVTFAQGPAGTA